LIERAFALVPLVEIDAALIIPQHGRAEALLDGVSDQRIEKVKGPCQCPMLNALNAGAPAADKGRCE
jgi:2-amino-4-hydroxy-6-hydroxymethyldihydropteridine diphosphokinase